MIYLISKQKNLFETDLYKEISFKDAKEYLEGKNEFLYNMFVFKKEDFLTYGKFIFDVLRRWKNHSLLIRFLSTSKHT